MFTFRLCFLLQLMIWLSATIPEPALSERCNPEDKKALLQFKEELGGGKDNPTLLSSWDPITDCCNNTWEGVRCDTETNRVNTIDLSNLDLHKPHHIPSSVGNLPFLDFLSFIQIPNLAGEITPAIANLTKLRNLFIHQTNVSGAIPEFLSQIKTLGTIDLAFNKLSGKIPASLFQLPNLVNLAIDDNQLTGAIPDSFGSFTNAPSVISLSRNHLSGKIPASFAKFDLGVVDLSRNKLSGDASVLFGSNRSIGTIRIEWNSFKFNLGKVEVPKNLGFLDVRHNHIYGRLPEGLTKLKFLDSLNVSYNHLCGKIPQGGKLQRFDPSSYAHNKCLCGSPLPSCKAKKE